tara:strand:+ start:1326 stop:1508 length:183 start_codon:yes stop_codon:yes gene_type:complete
MNFNILEATERFLENEKNSQELLILKRILNSEKKKNIRLDFNPYTVFDEEELPLKKRKIK